MVAPVMVAPVMVAPVMVAPVMVARRPERHMPGCALLARPGAGE
jgi:hypothetical protein